MNEIEKEKRDIVACRMLNAVRIPVTPDVLNAILDIVELASVKGELATMKELDDIVIKNTKQQINEPETNRVQ